MDSETVSIPQAIDSGRLKYNADRIGIVAPIYGHEMPQMVKAFIQHAKLDTDYLYLVLTYGARHANAVELAQNVFRRVSKQPDYIRTVLMVDNFVPAFDMKELMKGLAEHVYQMIILPFDPADPKNKSAWHIEEQMGRTACVSRRIGEEHLLFLLPESHPLADRASLTLRDLNGENLLLFSEIGFWGKIVRQKMPDSRFLVQSERYSFTELIA
ncbi:MAG: LysR substrate-binding domain-containing protein, partial [Butyricicoccus sp.]